MRRATAILCCSISLSGCAEFAALYADRYGPPPVLPVTYTGDAATREVEVLKALAHASLGNNPEPTGQWPMQWEAVVYTGFNVVDDACQAYITHLHQIDRRKTRINAVLSASNAATAAIIGATAHPYAGTLTILAQAFGLAGLLTDAIAESYLYTQPPATVYSLTKKSRDAYRTQFAAITAPTNPPLSGPLAYYHVREYLSLCLPATIQAQIDAMLAKAKADVAPKETTKSETKQVAGSQVTATKTTTTTTTAPSNPAAPINIEFR